MPGSLTWGWYPEGNKWVKLRVDEDGSIHVVGYVDKLDDIGDVNVPVPTDGYFLYWDNAASKWQCKALADGDIPASICRDTELATHAADKDAHHSNVADLTFIIDGGGSAITTGEKGHLRIPFACTINEVTMLADRAGAIVVDIWKTLYVGFPPDDGDSITSATPPTITATNQKSTDSALTNWDVDIAAGAILAFNVDSCATITRVTISLKVEKS